MFQSLRPNNQVFILHKDRAVLETGSVVSVSTPMPKYPVQPMFGQPQEMVVDIVVKVNNQDITYHRCSVVVIGLTTSAEEFQNTFDHEKGHLAMHICSALRIHPQGEEFQYLTGEIGQAMFKVAKRFLCDNCRKKLVIEFREIDNKK